MIFSIQRFLEDSFERRNLTDVDQFAVLIANLYDKRRGETSEEEFLIAMRKLRTLFYKNNPDLNRSYFEQTLLRSLDARFHSKKKVAETPIYFSDGLAGPRNRLRLTKRHSIRQLLLEYKAAVESRAIDAFWRSRKQGNLRARPENIAQALLATCLKMLFRDIDSGLVLREFASGVGFVDVGIVISKVLHVVELKVLTRSFQGAIQLEQYMQSENRREGWLVVVDARPDKSKTKLPAVISSNHGLIKTIVLDINPTAPSKRKSKSQ
jgi:hypothetical protein